ncbi:hypothetical protein GCM10027586_15610 [Kineococcus gypseus]|uniref:hypothetical protein n=1 Tax=Kineococcus gypseus TaxID=1637102 RepID=UPI003D7CB061
MSTTLTRTPATTLPSGPGHLLSVRAISLLCLDETEHEGFWPAVGEGIANDAMRLFALVTTQVGAGAPTQHRTAVLNLGDDYEDGRRVDFDHELARVFIPSDVQWPVKLNALLFLAEEDWGGQEWDKPVREIIDLVGGAAGSALSKLASTAVGGALGGAGGGPVGAAVGVIAGFVVGAVADALKDLESDVFRPNDLSVVLQRPTDVLAGPDPRRMVEHLFFEDFGGRYQLTCEVRLTPVPVPGSPRTTIDLMPLAALGHWVGGRLVDAHVMTDAADVRFGDTANLPLGAVVHEQRALEDGLVQDVLHTHPKWLPRGTIKGWLPDQLLPVAAKFEAEVGYVAGATGSDGVDFKAFAHRTDANGRRVWHQVLDVHKDYTGRLQHVSADLSRWAGTPVGIELRVDAGSSPSQDWAVWSRPRIVGY